ncbi:MAG: RNA polymerase sigma factor [Patescibacteria group bacterium]|nr:RNA polymerase sigma factor [Patescibacteria group bacterium]
MEKTKDIDKNILIRAKTGDLEAFEYILSFYEKAIYNYCLRMIKNSQNAKDITQETFIKVYTHRKEIDPEKNIKTWIFTIATNTTYDFIRSKKRKRETSLDEKTERNETIPNLEAYYPREGLVSDVERALEQINPKYGEALILFYQQGFEYKEIAEILNIPINTIKTHISRGKDQLKDILKEYGKD